MKKAPPVRLSLRKLIIAMLAVGPISILPSPLLAAVPTATPFTVSSGTGTWNGQGNTGTINVSNRAVLTWGTTAGTLATPHLGATDGSTFSNFIIEGGHIFNFQLPSGGAVLNRVTAGSNSTNAVFNGLGAAAAVINGSLIAPNGQVAILANGNIIVGSGAQIQTATGLVLSTLNEDNFSFTSTGNLALTGASQGNIYIGGGTTAVTSLGSLTAAGGTVVPNNLTVTGDFVVNQVGAATGLVLTGVGNPTQVSGNFTATSNNGAITQGTGALVASGNSTTLRSGTGSITLNEVGNDFTSLTINTTGTGGDVTITDANIVSLAASTIGGDLNVRAGGQLNTIAIASTGTLTIGESATFTSTATNNSGVNIAHNSTIAGPVNASTYGGAITINTTGNLVVGNILQNVTTGRGAPASGAASVITAGIAKVDIATAGAGYTSAPTVVIAAPPPGGVQATATATINAGNGTVTGITIDNPGSGYTSVPVVSLTGGGFTTAATITPFVAVQSATVTTASGADAVFGKTGVYSAAPGITFPAAVTGETRATGNVVSLFSETTGAVTTGAVTIQNAGAYATFPTTVTFGEVLPGATVIRTAGALEVRNNVHGTTNTTITGGTVTFNTTGNVNTTGLVTINSLAGNVQLGTVTGNRINSTAVGGNISQITGLLTTTQNDGTSAYNAGTGTVILDSANAFISGHVVQFPAASAVTFRSANQLTVGTSNVTGNLVLTANSGNLVLGTGTGSAGQNITVGGVLTGLTQGAGADIIDGDYSAFNIAGGLNLTTALGAGANVVLDGASINGSLAPSVQFGQVNINAGLGNATVSERTTLNLGNITAVSLNATSVAGDIINTGTINVTTTGTANFTTTGASTSVITNGTNTIGTVNFIGSGGAVTVAGGVTLGAATNVTAGDDLVVTSTGAGAVTLAGATVGGHLTVNSAGTIATGPASNTTVGGNLSLNAADTSASSITTGLTTTTPTGRLIVTGVTTIAAGGNVTLNAGNDFIGGVALNQATNTGNVQVFDFNNLTISGASAGFVEARAGGSALAIDNPWNLVLGNLSVGSLWAVATNGGGGNSGTITQATGSSLHVEGKFQAATNAGNIVLANAGNSAGRVEFWTNGAGVAGSGFGPSNAGNGTATISYTEDGTMRVGNLASNSNITLRSNFGSIIEDTNADVLLNARATLNATAPNGSILLGGTTNTTTTVSGNVATFIANAPSGAVAVTSNNNITLGAINANSLSVTATNNISQSAALSVFGGANFTSTQTTETRAITLTNNANNFGPVSLSIGNETSTITVNEGNTLNLRRVTMPGGGNGTFTATSINGDIIDSGFAGVVLGGNATTTGTGVVTLSATNGNITFINPSTDIRSSSGLVFNAKDVTLSILGNATTPLLLGAVSAPSAATGNLTVTNLLGSIGNSGAMTAGGTAFFQTPSGSISIGQSGVGFGVLKFIGQQVSISESGNMDIATGSTATQAANLVSGGNIAIVNVGGGNVTFASTVNMTATGNINPANLLQAGGLLRVTHTGTADLSGLSIQSNLNGIAPVDAGTGAYVPPAP